MIQQAATKLKDGQSLLTYGMSAVDTKRHGCGALVVTQLPGDRACVLQSSKTLTYLPKRTSHALSDSSLCLTYVQSYIIADPVRKPLPK